ncbi:MAG: hypothetical protein HYR60_32075 [Acidobacteria bacterium]|nr:hypothetical protein [Acidobacteriota bacterium]
MKRILWTVTALAGILTGQVDRGNISGTVTDATGSLVPGVAISLVQEGTNAAFQVA